MSYPPDYNKTTNFVEYAGNNPASPYNPPQHDAEFDNIEATLDSVVALLKSLTRSDGQLANNSVKPEALSTVALEVLTAGWTPRGNWATGVYYSVGDLVEGAASVSFVCSVAHTSAASIDTDRGYGRWVCIGNGVSAAVNDVINYATQAAAAKTAAETAAGQAVQSRDQCVPIATAAIAASSTAAANATSANDSAVSAAASAAAALNHTPYLASNVAFSPSGNVSSTTVQAAIAELESEKIPSTAIGVSVQSYSALLSAIAAGSQKLEVPAGTILDFGGSSIPAGYLACPNSVTNVSRTTYAALFAAVGTLWGAGNGSTTFGIPYFPYGFGSVAHVGTIGVTSSGGIQDHTHAIATANGATSVGGAVAGHTGVTGVAQSVTGNNYAAGMRVQKIVKY